MILEKPNQFLSSITSPQHIPNEALFFTFKKNALLVTIENSDKLTIPSFAKVQETGIQTIRKHHLGKIDDIHCYVAEVLDTQETPEGMDWMGLRAIFSRLDQSLFALAGRSFQIIDWDRTHEFCGRCGTKTNLGNSERVKICPACGQRHYPRIAPAVMALISRGNDFLLARSPHFPTGMFSALAGFSEPGETLEQTVSREVYEEVGIEVSNIRYFASQPWPFPHSMMIAFHCDYKSGQINCDPVEIEAADWFNADKLPPRLPGDISIARKLVNSKLFD